MSWIAGNRGYRRPEGGRLASASRLGAAGALRGVAGGRAEGGAFGNCPLSGADRAGALCASAVGVRRDEGMTRIVGLSGQVGSVAGWGATVPRSARAGGGGA